MPKRTGLETNPRVYAIDEDNWPDSPLKDDAPPEAVVLQIISKAFRAAVEARPDKAKFAKNAGISRRAVRNIMRGETWMDLPTLYRIEEELQLEIWLNSKRTYREQS